MTSPSDEPKLDRGRGPMFAYAPGSQPLAGYVIKRGLGQGGFGEVYFAVSDAGKEVALKLVRRNLEVELRGVRQCLNLKHGNLLALYDVRIDADGNHWIVMEYVSGPRLVDVLARHPNGLPTEEALQWFRGIAAGTAYLHDNGIVHRDLKPANLFLENGVVKLGDYGLAKFISVSRRSGQTESVGTVHYMAPEISNGRYGKQIDVYALGVILYELLTGRVPFDGESVGEILMKHLTAEPDLSAVPERFRSAVAAALLKDPARRPQTVGALVRLVDPAWDGAAPTVPMTYVGDAADAGILGSDEPTDVGHPAASPQRELRTVAPTCAGGGFGSRWGHYLLLPLLFLGLPIIADVVGLSAVSREQRFPAIFATYALLYVLPASWCVWILRRGGLRT